PGSPVAGPVSSCSGAARGAGNAPQAQRLERRAEMSEPDEQEEAIWGNVCMDCGKSSEELGRAMLRCGRCRCKAYCGPECQRAGFPQHKRHCRMMTYIPMQRLRASMEANKQVDDNHPLLAAARVRLAAAPADRRAQLLVIAARLCGVFLGALRDDIFVAENEEGLWGLRGEPRSPGYQHLYRSSDITAAALFEAVAAAPQASAALTRLLTKGVRYVCTEDDSPEMIEMAVERHLANTQGLVVDSDVDRLPLGPAWTA
ncbi:MAG: hypothetical protein J3K34DRAFT_480369, partial [Monoraphidium minutum]